MKKYIIQVKEKDSIKIISLIGGKRDAEQRKEKELEKGGEYATITEVNL